MVHEALVKASERLTLVSVIQKLHYVKLKKYCSNESYSMSTSNLRNTVETIIEPIESIIERDYGVSDNKCLALISSGRVREKAYEKH